jgi:hypothetical protein
LQQLKRFHRFLRLCHYSLPLLSLRFPQMLQ